jgi:hypothetical protein
MTGWFAVARWTGDPAASDVLQAAEAWRERCFIADGSLFLDGAALWTFANVDALNAAFSDNPIEGKRSFLEKFKEQLARSSVEVKQLAAEFMWLLMLFPHKSAVGSERKIGNINEVWSWSGQPLPDSPYLNPASLSLEGIGNPGTFYLTGLWVELSFLLAVLKRWKALPVAERNRLLTDDAPWTFSAWLDQTETAAKRPTRNALLYFLFPDQIERSTSSNHRRQIYAAFKDKLPENQRPVGANPSLENLDKAILGIRKVLEEENQTTDLDFYRPPLRGRWLTKLRDDARKAIGAELSKILSNLNLQLNQIGSKVASLEKTRPINKETGFWDDPSDATNKPLRWFVHLDLTGDTVTASLPPGHGSHRLGAFNAAQGNSGAVTFRVIPVIRLGDKNYVFYETWEWMLLFCFLPALGVGSSAQLIENFDAATGAIQYRGQPQRYIAAALIGLTVEDDVFSEQIDGVTRSLTYGQATQAIATLLHVDPTQPLPAPAGESSDGN